MGITNSSRNIQWSEVVTEIQMAINENLKFTKTFVSENLCQNDLITATIISLLFVSAYWSIIYFDSSQPGKNPLSPFSAFGNQKHHNHGRQVHFDLNYLTGAIIGGLIFLSIYFNIF